MYLTVSTGIAKPMPALAPDGEKIAVFIPIKFPEESSSGPPEFPGLIAASDCMTLVIGLPMGDLTSRPRPEMIPAVSVWSSPNGFPIAKANCPTLKPFNLKNKQEEAKF